VTAQPDPCAWCGTNPCQCAWAELAVEARLEREHFGDDLPAFDPDE